MDVCKNHPGRTARRRCYHCHDPICPDCQQTLDNHIFCSRRCHASWRRDARRERWIGLGRKLVLHTSPVLWWRYPPFRREQWAHRAMIAVWALLIAQLATAVALWTVAHRQPQLIVKEVAPTFAATVNLPRWIQEPHMTNGVVIGTADGGATGALLLRNGQVVATIAPETRYDLRDTPDRRTIMWSLLPAQTPPAREVWTYAEGVSDNVEQVRTARGIALTFDGGSSANVLDQILAILRSRNVRATFFLTGEFLQRYPEQTRRIVASGHEVGNHTWSHPHLTSWTLNHRHDTLPDLTRQRLQWELLRTEQLFSQITGTSMKALWRAPYGEVNRDVLDWASEIGYRHIGWTHLGNRETSLDTLDWVDDPADPAYVSGRAMADRILALAREPRFRGGIVLMHIGVNRRYDRVQDELGSLIDRLNAAAIPLQTVTSLLLTKS